MPFKFYLSLITVLLCASVYGQRSSIKAGSSFTYTFSFHYNTGQELPVNKSDTYRFEVLRRDDSGYYRVRCTLVGFSRYATGQKLVNNNLAENPYHSAEDVAGAALLYRPFELVVDTNGYLIRIKGIKEIITAKANEWQLKAPVKLLLLRTAGRNLQWQTREIFPALPATQKGWQDGWNSAVSSRTYLAVGTEGTVIHIGYTETNSEDGTANVSTELGGDLQYDSAARRVVSCIQKSVQTGERKDAKDQSVPFRVEQELTVTLVPDTFRYQAAQDTLTGIMVKMSNWSSALRNGAGYDSARVYAFFAANDRAWNSNRRYVLSKLDIIQSTPTANRHDKYKEILLGTPTPLLEGQYAHLYSKLQEVVNNNADSAYELITYLSKGPSYSEWVQHSFSQLFIEPGTMSAEQKTNYQGRYAIGKILLKKLVLEGDTMMRNATFPLFLWVESKDRSSDTVLQRDNIGLLELLSPARAKQGNAQRYALLLYKQAYTSGQKELAARLLSHIIARLETETNDSSNRSRRMARNMLAYAWTLKYQDLKEEDPKLAWGYLSKAAALSPKSPAELPAGSFYDRLFLGSKESYRADFAETLLLVSDKKQALKILAEQVEADPTLAGELRKAYEQHFPGKDFSKFLTRLEQENH
jgi:hypothetical protein